ncbi:hypothetical protein ACFE04_004236 [Oxalis oulophora]
MLLAVEGGGFFSSSASGYSKGLTLLLLGRNNNDNTTTTTTNEHPMKVSPWNHHYNLVEEIEPDPNNRQLASVKNRLSRGCATFVCFGRASAGLHTPSPLKVGPVRQQQEQDVLPSEVKNDIVVEVGDDETKVSIKSSLKKPLKTSGVLVSDASVDECEPLDERSSDGNIPCHAERRKVQWTDVCGSELVEIREFEPSDRGGSDDEFENGNERSCGCTIM